VVRNRFGRSRFMVIAALSSVVWLTGCSNSGGTAQTDPSPLISPTQSLSVTESPQPTHNLNSPEFLDQCVKGRSFYDVLLHESLTEQTAMSFRDQSQTLVDLFIDAAKTGSTDALEAALNGVDGGLYVGIAEALRLHSAGLTREFYPDIREETGICYVENSILLEQADGVGPLRMKWINEVVSMVFGPSSVYGISAQDEADEATEVGCVQPVFQFERQGDKWSLSMVRNNPCP